jgi:clorobiocin biosynthesis protein CloN6
MVEPVWSRRLSYDTEWLSRQEIQDVTYEAAAQLVSAKGEVGALPSRTCEAVLGAIAETQALLAEIERAIELDGGLPNSLRQTIRAYNARSLAYSRDQIVPMQRPLGSRWFDDYTVPLSMIEELTQEPR